MYKHSIFSIYRYRPSNVHVLQGFERYSKLCDQRDAKSSVGEFQRVCSIVKFNLSSNLPIVRQLSLLILFNLTNRMEISKVHFHATYSFLLYICLLTTGTMLYNTMAIFKEARTVFWGGRSVKLLRNIFIIAYPTISLVQLNFFTDRTSCLSEHMNMNIYRIQNFSIKPHTYLCMINVYGLLIQFGALLQFNQL